MNNINILNEVILSWKDTYDKIGGNTLYMSAEYVEQPNAERYGYNVPGITTDGDGGFTINLPPLYRSYEKALEVAKAESAKKDIWHILDYVKNIVWIYDDSDSTWHNDGTPLKPWEELNRYPSGNMEQYWPLRINSKGPGYLDSPPVWIINAIKIN